VVDVLAVLPHTHRLGLGLRAWIAGGARDGEMVYEVVGWEDLPLHFLDPPLPLAPGEGLRFQCRYLNTTEATVVYGTSATDEMCLLSGYYATGAEALWGESTDAEPACTALGPGDLGK
jgi:hypothetical protein